MYIPYSNSTIYTVIILTHLATPAKNNTAKRIVMKQSSNTYPP